MTHVDDLYEPGDDREPEPCEWYPAPEPVDLDNLQKLYDLAEGPGALPEWRSVVYLEVPGLIAELREARERLARWEALPTREEWAVTQSRDSVPGDGVTVSCDVQADHARWLARSKDAQMWRRMLAVLPWEPISDEAPF